MILLLALLAVVSTPQNAKNDVQETRFHRVHLINGNFVDGDLISQTALEVNLRIKTGTMTIGRDLIDRVELVKMRLVKEAPTPVAKPDAPPRLPSTAAPDAKPTARAPAAGPLKAAAEPHVPTPPVRAQVDALVLRLKQAAPEGVDGILREIVDVEGDTTSYVAGLMETAPERIAEGLGPVLSRRPDAAAIPYILRLFTHASGAIRTHAVAGVGAAGGRGQLPDLAGLAKDSSPTVRGAAVTAILDIKAAEGLDLLLPFAGDADRGVRRSALNGLSQLAGDLDLGERLPVLLTSLLRTSGAEARPEILQAIGHLRIPALAARVVEHLNATSTAERVAAAGALAEIGHAESADAVQARMESEGNEEVRVALAAAAVKVKARNSVPALIGWLGDSSEAVKGAALAALKAFSGKDFKEDVEQWTAWWEKSQP